MQWGDGGASHWTGNGSYVDSWAMHGPKRKNALVATLHVRAKLLYRSRRIGACSDFAWPSGTLWSSARSVLPSRGGRRGGRWGARTHLICFSFRAFRFATRCPGGRGGLCPTRPKAFRVPVGADALIGPLQHGLEPAQDQQVEGIEYVKEPFGKAALGAVLPCVAGEEQQR